MPLILWESVRSNINVEIIQNLPFIQEGWQNISDCMWNEIEEVVVSRYTFEELKRNGRMRPGGYVGLNRS